jgi:hypothetical protein
MPSSFARVMSRGNGVSTGVVSMPREREAAWRCVPFTVVGHSRQAGNSGERDCLALLNGWLEPSWFTSAGPVMPSQTGRVEAQHGSSKAHIGQLAHALPVSFHYAFYVIAEVILV